jgi:hypothetical protein
MIRASDLWLDRSLLEKGADLQGLRSTRRITLYGSKVTGPLEMTELDLRGDLSMGGKAEFAAVDLGFAHVGGYLDLSGSTVSEDLNVVGLQVDGSLFMDNAKLTRVDFTSARVHWLLLDGSRVTGLLNMAELRVDNHLIMSRGEFASVLLGLARVQGHLILANSKIAGDLVMDGLHVGGDLVGMNAQFNRASLRAAVVGGSLSLIGTTVNGDLDMTRLRVGRDLLATSVSEKLLTASLPESLRSTLNELGIKADGNPNAILKARFAKVTLTGASIQGGLALAGATVMGDLAMDGVQIGGDLTMVDGEYQAVELERAHIAGVFNLRGSKMGGQLDCYASEIGSRFELSDGEFDGSISCSFAKIGELDLAGGTFQDNVDLAGTQIKSELQIGSVGKARTQWADKSTLYLRNATADAIQDLPDAWPARIDLSGFAYRNLARIIHEALEAAVLQRDRRAVFRGVGDAVVGV